jgi:ABC-2 type transport system permease protein
MSGKLWAVVRREYLQRVRSKAFIIATLIGPLLMGGLMILPALMLRAGGGTVLRVAVLDAGSGLLSEVEETLRAARVDDKPRFDVQPSGEGSLAERERALKEAVVAGRLDGYLSLPRDVVETSGASYYGRTVSNRIDLRVLEQRVSEVVVSHRLSAAGIDPGQVKDLTRGLDLRTVRLTQAGEKEDRGVAVIFSIVLLMILYTSILMWGQVVMTSIIEEKTSRVIEVVASGVPPTQLLAGKLLGVGAAGLTQFLVWSVSLSVVSLAAAGPMLARLPLPDLSPLVLVSFVVFFLLGFAFYASLYASVGSAVNTVQEAQQFMFPVIIPLILGLVCFPVVIESPDGAFAVALSLLPFLAPLLMFLRIVVLTPPLWQIALSVVLLVLAILGVLWVAARIYRVGILMYGKKPTFPELMRWVRHA